jgi:hypothetical protein
MVNACRLQPPLTTKMPSVKGIGGELTQFFGLDDEALEMVGRTLQRPQSEIVEGVIAFVTNPRRPYGATIRGTRIIPDFEVRSFYVPHELLY